MRELKFLAVLVASFCLSVPVQASDSNICPARECFSAEAVRADLHHLYSTMRESHFNLYARVPEPAYDARLAELVAEVDGPMPKPEAHLMMQWLLAFGRVGHARTEAPIQDALAHVQGGGKILPINVRIVDGRMLLDEWADAEGALEPGSEILSIGGIAVADLYRRLRTIVSADTDQLLQAQVEQALPIFLYLLFGSLDRATVDARLSGGDMTKASIPAVDFATMQSLGADDPVAEPALDPGKREFGMLGEAIAYLRPGPFGNIEGEPVAEGETYDPEPFDAFLTEAFEQFKAERATDLVIDLRGNQGGDNSFSDLMIARIADQPFRFASRFLVKASAANKAQYAKQQIEPQSLMAMMAAKEMSAANGTVYEVELPLVAPRTANRFEGKVWVLIDRHSYSNAAVVAAVIQDYGFGTLMGEATADLATTFGSIEHFTLPESGSSVAYPKSYMVRPSGDERVRGVQPDVPLPVQPIDDAVDRVLESALAHIAKSRQAGGN